MSISNGTGVYTDSNSGGGFTFHQKTPKISDTQVNPAKDGYSTVKQTVTQVVQQATGQGLMEKNKSCPKFLVSLSVTAMVNEYT